RPLAAGRVGVTEFERPTKRRVNRDGLEREHAQVLIELLDVEITPGIEMPGWRAHFDAGGASRVNGGQHLQDRPVRARAGGNADAPAHEAKRAASRSRSSRRSCAHPTLGHTPF